MQKFLLSFLLIYFHTQLQYAQVGINTLNPQALFHIDGAKDNPTQGTPSTTAAANDFIVTSNGAVGTGVLSPKVKLDTRSTNNTAAGVAIGYTNQSAAQAGAGALRYQDVSGGLLQVSDGVTWNNTFSNPTKSFVAAHIVANNATVKFGSTPTDVKGWSTVKDINSDFVASTGIFKARRDGVYNINFSYDFVQGSVVAGSMVEAQVIKSETTIVMKCLKTFAKANRDSQAGGNCNASVYLNKGETLNTRLKQTINSTSIGLRSTTTVDNPFYGFNNISITEL